MTPRPRFAAFYCIYDDDDWLAPSVESIYPVSDAIYFFVSDVPWNGPSTGNENTIAAIKDLPDVDNKIVIIRGNWNDQVLQRNEAIALLEQRGFDYAFIVDADEIYETINLKHMMEYAAERPQVGCWHALFIIFWKSHKYRIDPPEEHHPPIFLKLGAGKFVEYRNPITHSHELVPPEIGFCFHMSYARTDEQILRKITSCSFAPLVRKEWYEHTWKAWDNDHSITDLCPYNPGVFHKAIEVPFAGLPSVLKSIVQPY